MPDSFDRRCFELFFETGDAEAVLAALRAYRNTDGGYGHGLEPDLRAPESQPAAAWHAFEVFADVAPVVAPEAAVTADLERLKGEQKDDGGWSVDFRSYSPAAALEWRGYATVRARCPSFATTRTFVSAQPPSAADGRESSISAGSSSSSTTGSSSSRVRASK
jgi:hypothetical protein